MFIGGIHSVNEALESAPERIQRILVASGRRGARLQQVVEAARRAGLPVHTEPAAALQRKAGGAPHQGIVAEIAAAPLLTLDAVLEQAPDLLLVADGVEDPRNLGALMRTADAAGVGALLLPSRRSVGLTPAVARTSAGAMHHLRVARIGNVAHTLRRLQRAGYTVVGLDPGGSEDLPECLAFPLAVVVGGESRGLRPLVGRHCDWRVRLPMRGRVQSLNLAVAAGVLLYRVRDLVADATRPGSAPG